MDANLRQRRKVKTMIISMTSEAKGSLAGWKRHYQKEIELYDLERFIKKYPEKALEVLTQLQGKGATWIAQQIAPILEAAEKEVQVVNKPRKIEITSCEYDCKKG